MLSRNHRLSNLRKQNHAQNGVWVIGCFTWKIHGPLFKTMFGTRIFFFCREEFWMYCIPLEFFFLIGPFGTKDIWCWIQRLKLNLPFFMGKRTSGVSHEIFFLLFMHLCLSIGLLFRAHMLGREVANNLSLLRHAVSSHLLILFTQCDTVSTIG